MNQADLQSPLTLLMKDIRRYKRLSKDEEIALARRYQDHDDLEALDGLVNANLALVIWLGRRMSAWGNSRLNPSEIISIGLEQLFNAAMKWNPNGSAAFAAFARHFIVRGIMRQGDREDRIVMLPLNISEKIRKLKYAERKLLQTHGRPPKVSELASATGFTEKRIRDLQAIILANPLSLDQLNQQKENKDDEF